MCQIGIMVSAVKLLQKKDLALIAVSFLIDVEI